MILSKFLSRHAFNPAERRAWVVAQSKLIEANARVLDVGAGSGQYRGLFAHCDYRAQDFGQEPGTIGKYARLDYECDILSIPVADDSFDAVLCTEVLEHVPEPILAVKEIARILKPGGKLLLSAPLGSFLHQEPYHFYGGYTPYWYRRFLPEAGFEVVSVERNQGFFHLFAQEGARFSYLLRCADGVKGSVSRLLLLLLWLGSYPFVRILPSLVAGWLDGLNLESTVTVGYHVVAVKKRGNQGLKCT